jgi:hypothetical protein
MTGYVYVLNDTSSLEQGYRPPLVACGVSGGAGHGAFSEYIFLDEVEPQRALRCTTMALVDVAAGEALLRGATSLDLDLYLPGSGPPSLPPTSATALVAHVQYWAQRFSGITVTVVPRAVDESAAHSAALNAARALVRMPHNTTFGIAHRPVPTSLPDRNTHIRSLSDAALHLELRAGTSSATALPFLARAELHNRLV